MEAKGPKTKEPGENNPIKNFCWPLSGREEEECIRNYEDVFDEKSREEDQDEEK